MPTAVDMPDGTRLEFPDEMAQDAIRDASRRKYPGNGGNGDESPEGLAAAERVADLAIAAKQTPQERVDERAYTILGEIPEVATKPFVRLARSVTGPELAAARDVLKEVGQDESGTQLGMGGVVRQMVDPERRQKLFERIGSLPQRAPEGAEQIAAGMQQAVGDA